MAAGTRLPPKKEVVLALLEGTDVFVHLDPRHEGVKVPPWFKHQPHLVLQVGLNMPVPIPDLEVDDDAVSCTLSFNRSPFFCFVPWKAVYALVGADGRAMVWPDDVPPEVAAQAEQVQKKQQQKQKRAKLRAVPSDEEEAAAEVESEAAEALAADTAASVPAAEEAPVAEPASPEAATSSDHESPDESEVIEPQKGKKRELPPYLRVVK